MKQQQTDLFKKRKEEYDAAGSAEEKTALVKQYNSSQYYEPQDKKSLENKNNIQQAISNVNSLTSKNEIVSPNISNTMQTQYQKPTNVIAADGYLKAQLQKIQSGKTSYSDQIKNMMAQIQGRDKFSYDVDSDPLFQQALASAMSSGKTAMQDTIGQASALTGGYGSTYATSAGNQAYNAFIQDAYDNLPQYYQMAMDAYQREGDELYRQYGLLVDADATEYGRNITAYDAMSQYRNQLYNEDYQMHRDSKADALSLANLQLSEHGQLMSDAMNKYNVNADYENTLFNRDYQSWLDSVNNAWKQIDFERGVYEADRNYNRGVYEADRKYERDNFEADRSFEEKQSQYNDSQYWKKQDQANWEKQYKVTTGDMDGNGVLSDSEIENLNKLNQKKGSVAGIRSDYTFSTTEQNAIREIYNSAGGGTAGEEAVSAYLDRIGKAPTSEEEIALVTGIFSEEDAKITLNGKKYTPAELEGFLQQEGFNASMILKYIDSMPKGKTVTFGKYTYTK